MSAADVTIQPSVAAAVDWSFMKITSLLIAAAVSVSCQAADVAPSKPRCIGYVSVDGRDNIELNLFSTEATHGGAMLLINKADPRYTEIRKHVGSLRPRVWKCVKPWQDKALFERNIEPTSRENRMPLPKH